MAAAVFEALENAPELHGLEIRVPYAESDECASAVNGDRQPTRPSEHVASDP